VPSAYIVPPAYAQTLAAKFDLHGIRYERMERCIVKAAVEGFRATKVTFSPVPFEGRFRAELEGAWQAGPFEVKSNSLIVPTSQPLVRLIVALLEPQAPDSFAAWGFFNAHFEQKEYLEPYVAEQIAREMLETDSELQRQFHESLAADPTFAGDPAARLEFFLRRHESWDERYNLYPIYRAREPFGTGGGGASG
jgi:hypothetical protein